MFLLQASFNPEEISLDDDEDAGNNTFESFSDTPRSGFLNSSQSSLPGRKRLELPPPKCGTDPVDELPNEPKNSSSAELDILESVLGTKSESLGEGAGVEENPFFVIDTVGEPQLKKRRNESLYKSILDGSDEN